MLTPVDFQAIENELDEMFSMQSTTERFVDVEQNKAMREDKRKFFLWDDGDGGVFVIPIEFKLLTDDLDALHPVHNCSSYAEFEQKYHAVFSLLEPHAQRWGRDTLLVFENPEFVPNEKTQE